MSVNKVFLLGNLGADPKVLYQNDKESSPQIVSASLATRKKAFTTSEGRQVPERTTWHNLVFKGKMAENAVKFLKVGNLVYIEGELENRTFEGKNEQKHYVTDISVKAFEKLSLSKKEQDSHTAEE
jgi:single-strand DNA-binding protein